MPELLWDEKVAEEREESYTDEAKPLVIDDDLFYPISFYTVPT